jgi:hypothetical protein
MTIYYQQVILVYKIRNRIFNLKYFLTKTDDDDEIARITKLIKKLEKNVEKMERALYIDDEKVYGIENHILSPKRRSRKHKKGG